ncbi:MAG TPA: class I SAM-dependent methyltransferase [Polyangiaceae bacterium]|nr:class I SAM-dependent methyltransferase [Polyangiaceae bacterium]
MPNENGPLGRGERVPPTLPPKHAQIAYWNGPAAERWVREQETLDRAFVPFTTRLLLAAAIRPGERVLDVGCGCGTTTLAAADAVGPKGSVVGVDVSAPMLERAKERARGRAGVAFQLADAAVYRPDAPFDRAMSRFGVMFFDAPAAAFANIREALRPGGQLTFVCWRPVDENEWARIPYEAATRVVPPGPPPGAEEPGPFSFGDRSRVERILSDAGFREIGIVASDAEVVASETGLDEAVEFAISGGPAGRLLRDAPEGAHPRVREELRRTLAPFVRGERVTMGGAIWVVTGKST